MIKAVFFDWYNTIARFHPPREEQQVAACRQLGVEVSPQALRRAYPAADDFMARENAYFALRERPESEQQRFWAEYERMLLREVGVEVSVELALRIFQEVRRHPSDFVLFEDVLPTLQELKARGLTLGLLSNLRQELDELCQRLGLTPYLDFALTSAEVGFEKPHPAIFFEALKRASVKPAEALHVGDQYHSDVLGARGVGVQPLLLDRDGSWEEIRDCPRIKSLAEVLNYLGTGPRFPPL